LYLLPRRRFAAGVEFGSEFFEFSDVAFYGIITAEIVLFDDQILIDAWGLLAFFKFFFNDVMKLSKRAF